MVELEDLTIRYAVDEQAVDVLCDIDLAVAADESVAVIGPSGSGKTTLLLLLTGLEKPGGGSIRLAGVSMFALVLADEPTGNLDKRTGEKVGDLLFELHDEFDSTLIVATHDARMAQRCDRVLQLDEGRLIHQRGGELLV